MNDEAARQGRSDIPIRLSPSLSVAPVTRCGACERPLDHDHDPYYVRTDPGHYDDEHFEVVTGNGLMIRACWSCWMRWPTQETRRNREAPATVTQLGRGRTRVVYNDQGELVEYELLPVNESAKARSKVEPTIDPVSETPKRVPRALARLTSGASGTSPS